MKSNIDRPVSAVTEPQLKRDGLTYDKLEILIHTDLHRELAQSALNARCDLRRYIAEIIECWLADHRVSGAD